jgi:hypothetical protein
LWVFAVVFALLAPAKTLASDHADPAWLPNNEQEANLTGLFFFPDPDHPDRYIIILDTRPTLTAPPPYHFSPYAFSISIDTHSEVKFPADKPQLPPPGASVDVQAPKPAPALPAPTAEAQAQNAPASGQAPPAQKPAPPADAQTQMLEGDFARYGGTVVDPGGIKPDIKFTIRLEDDATLRQEKFSFTGLKAGTLYKVFNDATLPDLKANPDKYKDLIWVYTGVRDDPFIFPKFFNVNVVTMTISVPKSAFPGIVPGQHYDWLLWASSSWAKNGKKIDHVGRSNRTQLGRFDVLNTEEPNNHVKVLQKVTASRVKVQDFLKQVLRPVSNLNQLSGFLLRSYDYAPDVMIFSTRFDAKFPNGRQLRDDVAAITCANGDCPLEENSYIDSKAYPRATVNDKEFLKDFPYLAEPWPFRPQPFTGSPWNWFVTNLLPPIILIAVLLLLLAAVWRRVCARLKAATAQDPET